MSSHHFVKEGQEPPLIILEWNDRLEAHAKQLFAWQPVVWVHESCLHQFLTSGFKPDGIIGTVTEEFDFLEPLQQITENELSNLFSEATLLINKDVEEMCNMVLERSLTVYSDEFKLYRYNKTEYKKWMPEDKRVCFFENGLNEIPRDNKGRLVKTFKELPLVIIEEL